MKTKTTYNPEIHHRKSIRLKGYDYSKAGAYFITICCEKHKCRFGKIIEKDMDAKMILNDFGTIAYQQWEKLPDRFTNIELDVFQIMPNHMHWIIFLTDYVSWTGASPACTNGVNDEKPKDVGDIVGAYKSLVSNECLEIFKKKYPAKMMGKLWQRNYHEHIIRDEESYNRISEYIINNPANWKKDKYFEQ